MNIGVKEVRDNLADALNRVAYQGERIVLERRGKGVAVLVSMDDLALLEAVEDKLDIAEAKKALAEGGFVPLEDIESRLGMTTPTKVKASKAVKPDAATDDLFNDRRRHGGAIFAIPCLKHDVSRHPHRRVVQTAERADIGFEFFITCGHNG